MSRRSGTCQPPVAAVEHALNVPARAFAQANIDEGPHHDSDLVPQKAMAFEFNVNLAVLRVNNGRTLQCPHG